MVPFTLALLKAHIDADPFALGLKNTPTPGDWKDDSVITDLLNGINELVADVDSVPSDSLRAATMFDWFGSLVADKQEFLKWQIPGGSGPSGTGGWKVTAEMKLLMTGRTLSVGGLPGVGANNNSWWTGTGDQNAAAPVMLALIEIPASAAMVEWGVGKVISVSEVGAAANV